MSNDIIVSSVSALVALCSVITAIALGRRANKVAEQAMHSARKSADAAESSAKAANDLIDLQREQWNEARSALFHLDPGFQLVRKLSGETEFDGISFEMTNRGKADAIDVNAKWYAKEGSSWTQLHKDFVGLWKPGKVRLFGPKMTSNHFEHYAGIMLVLHYSDIAVHTDKFELSKRPQELESLRLVSATHDGSPHPAHPKLHI